MFSLPTGIFPSITNPSTNSPSPQPTSGRLPMATIAGASIGGLIAIVIIILVSGAVAYCVIIKRPNKGIILRKALYKYMIMQYLYAFISYFNEIDSFSNLVSHKDVALPVNMIPNENYCNPQEALYDSVLTLKELTRPSTNGSAHHSNGGTTGFSPTTPVFTADAPLLPPPRTNTAIDHSQGPYSQILPLRERRNMSPLAPLTIEEADYIPMKAATDPPIGNTTGGSSSAGTNNLSVTSGSGGGAGNGPRPAGAGPVVSPRYIEAPVPSNFSTPNTANGHHHTATMGDSPVVYAIPGPANSTK